MFPFYKCHFESFKFFPPMFRAHTWQSQNVSPGRWALEPSSPFCIHPDRQDRLLPVLPELKVRAVAA